MSAKKKLGIGLLGLGTVGRSVYDLIRTHQDSLSHQIGAELEIKKIAVRDSQKDRKGLRIDRRRLTTEVREVVEDPDIDIIVELMGGVDDARRAVMAALENDKQVVSANKALVAVHGEELFELAQQKQRDFLFEAAVGGGIPILRVLRESFSGNRTRLIMAIVNGTCNFILTRMTQAFENNESGVEFAAILKEAQDRGYAEADPTMDIDGTDTVQKLAILSSLAFGAWIDYRQIFKEGITKLNLLDFEMADYFGFRIKLLAIAKESDEGLEMRVHPTLLSKNRPLARVDGVFNAIYVDSDPLGPSLFYGQGAGGGPTASAVVADIVDLGRNLMTESAARVAVLPFSGRHLRHPPLREMKDLVCRYYLRLSVVDRSGALGDITRILGENQVSIAALLQMERDKSKPVPVVLLTHDCREESLQKAIDAIDNLEVVVDRPLLLRIEE